MTGADHPDDPFAAYHRALDRRRLIVAVVGGIVAVSAVVAGVGMASAPSAAAPVAAVPIAAVASMSSSPSQPPPTTLVADPASVEAPSPASAPVVAPAVASAAPPITIDVTATGYQAELDACQWVRMDIGAIAPIVGAHTHCDGAVVLGLTTSESVSLVGQGLDGTYVVGGSRDAHAGDDAASATAGMTAAVILQTCYPGAGGRVRLVALLPAGG